MSRPLTHSEWVDSLEDIINKTNKEIMKANDKQVGGQHYKTNGEQHWDRIYRLYGRGYFVGCATKYLERFHLKNGKEDLEKAIHFIEKLKELEFPTQALDGGPTERYVNQD